MYASNSESRKRIYPKPEPAVIDAAHLERQRGWSEYTFGPGTRLHGVLDHIRKELGEIEADPTDLFEWVDVLILAFDGAWRAGWKPQQIIDAIVAKQAKNESREWPDWRTASPDQAIEHVRTASWCLMRAALIAATALMWLVTVALFVAGIWTGGVLSHRLGETGFVAFVIAVVASFCCTVWEEER